MYDDALTAHEQRLRDILSRDSAVVKGITDDNPIPAAKQVHIFWCL
jgi:hypothetical protein